MTTTLIPFRTPSVILALWALISCLSPAPAQTPAWIKGYGGIGSDEIHGMTTDGSYIYLVGTFEGTCSFGTNTLTSAGDFDIFIAKLDPSGSTVWVRKGGGTAYDYGYGITLDNNNDVIITGQCLSQPATFQTLNYTPVGNDLFVAKYDNAGNIVWLQHALSNNAASVTETHGVATDNTGQIYVSGFYSGFFTIQGQSTSDYFNDDSYLMKMSSTGTVQWLKSFDGNAGHERAYAITVDNSSGIIIAGEFSGQVAFDTVSLQPVNGNQQSLFIAKFNTSGDGLWANALGGGNYAASNEVNNLETDNSGNVYAVGLLSVNGIAGTDTCLTNAFWEGYCVKYSAAGAYQWIRYLGQTTGTGSRAYDIRADNNNLLYWGGYFDGSKTVINGVTVNNTGGHDALIEKLDEAGDFYGFAVGTGLTNGSVRFIDLSAGTDIFASGSMLLQVQFGASQVGGPGGNDMWLARFTNSAVSVETNSLIGDLALFPNPAEGELHLAFYATDAANASLSIRSLQGQALLERNLEIRRGYNAIDLSTDNVLPASGIYILSLSGQGFHVVRKIVVADRF